MHQLLFTGPTFSYADIDNESVHSCVYNFNSVDEYLEHSDAPDNALFVFPPISGGDLYRLKDHSKSFLIAIIDGYFENTVSVWHKEILYFLSRGVYVMGASSMGALRASELQPYGMIGVGNIYNDFLTGRLQDDDEVTVSHGPRALNYPQISEAMINIRYTIEHALNAKIITINTATAFLKTAKILFYKERNYQTIIKKCSEINVINKHELIQFQTWLEKNKVSQKQLDARELLNKLSLCRTYNDLPTLPSFEFEDTIIWRRSMSN
ncbi:MAG: tfuA protein [Alphaproteobacteria bacterium]|nr:tfuA protein [Alphaproteobacteria bacterium]